MKPLVSVIIPNWNGKHLLARCLKSLQEQTYKKVELIIVDNGSEDGSVKLIKSQYPSVKLITLTSNTGFAHAVNQGIVCARGDPLLILGNDTEVEKEFIRVLVDAADTYKDFDFFSTKIYSGSRPRTLDGIGDQMFTDGTCTKRGRNEAGSEYGQYMEVFGCSASAGLYRRKLFQETGLFDDSFFIGYDDPDINLRARLKGMKCLYVPDAVGYHREHGTLNIRSDFIQYLMFRNQLFFFVKDIPWQIHIKHFKEIGAFHVWWTLKDLFKLCSGFKYDETVHTRLRARRDVLLNLPVLLRKRRLIQSGRLTSWQSIDKMLVRR